MKKLLLSILLSVSAHAGVIQIPVSADLATVFKNAPNGASYQLIKGASYAPKSTVSIFSQNVSLDLNGATLNFGSLGGFAVYGPSFTIGNGTISKAGRSIVCKAKGISVHDMSFGSVDQVYLDENNLCPGATLKNITQTGLAGKVGVYFTSDNFNLSFCTLTGSVGEYDLREESINGHDPVGATIDHCTFSNDGNKFGKSAVGIRQGSVAITYSAFHGKNGQIRIGQLDEVTHCKIAGCNGTTSLSHVNFDAVTDPMPNISVDEGVIVSVDNSLFTVDSLVRPMAIGAYSKVTLTNNTIQRSDTSVVVKGTWGSILNPLPVVIEAGTVIK